MRKYLFFLLFFIVLFAESNLILVKKSLERLLVKKEYVFNDLLEFYDNLEKYYLLINEDSSQYDYLLKDYNIYRDRYLSAIEDVKLTKNILYNYIDLLVKQEGIFSLKNYKNILKRNDFLEKKISFLKKKKEIKESKILYDNLIRENFRLKEQLAQVRENSITINSSRNESNFNYTKNLEKKLSFLNEYFLSLKKVFKAINPGELAKAYIELQKENLKLREILQNSNQQDLQKAIVNLSKDKLSNILNIALITKEKKMSLSTKVLLYNHLARDLLKKKNYEKAISLFKKSFLLKKSSSSLEGIIYTYILKNDNKKAFFWYRKAIKLGYLNKNLKEVINIIK